MEGLHKLKSDEKVIKVESITYEDYLRITTGYLRKNNTFQSTCLFRVKKLSNLDDDDKSKIIYGFNYPSLD